MAFPVINTGQPRNVVGHIVSGAIASAIVSGTINYKKTKDKEIDSKDAVRDTLKKTTQGAVVAGAAVATSNYLAQEGGFFKALGSISIGMMGVYTIEKIDDKLKSKCESIEENKKLILQEGKNE